MAERVLSLEERVSRLEGWKESEERLVNGIRQDLHDLKERITHLEAKVDERITHLEAQMNERFLLVESRINHLEAQMNERITNLERKVDTYFRWMVGFQFTILLAIVSILLRLMSG
ncbi:hypothetical protein DRQ18_01375 [bacterium]|nr:MAG: hypothetical protein DRQ18_01375 [bacterium]